MAKIVNPGGRDEAQFGEPVNGPYVKARMKLHICLLCPCAGALLLLLASLLLRGAEPPPGARPLTGERAWVVRRGPDSGDPARRDVVSAASGDGGLIIRVVSERGIGAVDVEPREGAWPERASVWFEGFANLEELSVSDGVVTLTGGLRAGERKTVHRFDQRGVLTDKPDAVYTITVERKNGPGGAAIEVTLPPGFHPKGPGALHVSWIDAYR